MNLDGTQRKKVVEIDRNLQTNMGESINSGQAMLFHLGKFYVVSEDSVRRFDVKSWREEQYGSALDKAESLFFVGFNQEELLLQVATYNDGTNHYANSLIAYDPYTDTVRVVKQDLPLDITVYDDSFIVGTTSSADHYTTYLTDDTGAQYKLADDSGPAFLIRIMLSCNSMMVRKRQLYWQILLGRCLEAIRMMEFCMHRGYTMACILPFQVMEKQCCAVIYIQKHLINVRS